MEWVITTSSWDDKVDQIGSPLSRRAGWRRRRPSGTPRNSVPIPPSTSMETDSVDGSDAGMDRTRTEHTQDTATMLDSQDDTVYGGNSQAGAEAPVPALVPAAAREEPGQPVAVLRALAGNDSVVQCVRKVWELADGSYEIGRSGDSDVTVGPLHVAVSKHHMLLHVAADGTVKIEDQSKGGTFVGERKMPKDALITIAFGTTFCLGEPERGIESMHFIIDDISDNLSVAATDDTNAMPPPPPRTEHTTKKKTETDVSCIDLDVTDPPARSVGRSRSTRKTTRRPRRRAAGACRARCRWATCSASGRRAMQHWRRFGIRSSGGTTQS